MEQMTQDKFAKQLGEAQKEQELKNGNTATLEEAADNLDLDRFVVEEEKFLTPEMGDFYLGAVDDVYLRKIDAEINKGMEDAEDGEPGKRAAYYLEAPAITEPGESETALFLKASVSISDDDIDMGIVDGKTLNIDINTVSGDENGEALSNLKNRFDEAAAKYPALKGKANHFSVCLVGIDAPATAKWAKEVNVKADNCLIEKKKISEISSNSNYFFATGVHDENTAELSFINVADRWRECEFYGEEDKNGTNSFRWLIDQGSADHEGGALAAKKMKELIDNAGGEVWLLLEKTGVGHGSSSNPDAFGGTFDSATSMKQLEEFAADTDNIEKSGYGLCVQEATRRFAGEAYIKQDGKWVNLVKAVLSDKSNQTIKDDTTYNGDSNMFDMQSYNFESHVYGDAYLGVLDEIDDRKGIIKDIFNVDFENLRTWNVTLGDVTFFVPPTSITFVSESINERMPLIRAKGSMTKTGQKTNRMVELTLYFNEEQGINGYPYKVKTPAGKELTYHMNGLRALMAQFRFTPFLPIENKYVNETLGIDAVTVTSLSISNEVNYPKLIKASLVLTEFDYKVYIPEAIAMSTDSFRNWFSASFNWATMRYYYQRCIMAGNELASKEYDFNSKEYIQATLGNKTVLQPMKFLDSTIQFYVANTDYLDSMLQTKMEMLKGKDVSVGFDQVEKQALKDLGSIHELITDCVKNNTRFNESLKKANEVGGIGISKEYAYTFGGAKLKEDGGCLGNIGLRKMLSAGNTEEIVADDDDQSDVIYTGLNGAIDALQSSLDHANANAGRSIIKKVSFGRSLELSDESGVAYSDYGLMGKTLDSMFSESSGKISPRGSAHLKVGLIVEINLDYFTNDSQYEDLKSDISNYIDEDKDSIMSGNKLFIPLSCSMSKLNKDKDYFINDDGQNFVFDESAPDVKFLACCENLAKDAEAKTDVDRRSAVNLEQLDSIVFDKYDAGTVRIKSYTASMMNKISKVSVIDTNGSSPQYLGGEDIIISMIVETRSLKTVGRLSNLPKLIGQYSRAYHMVLPCCPLKVASEITAFLGVNEVTLDRVQVLTESQNVSKFVVQLDMRSVDRTLRNREAAVKIEANNFGSKEATESAARSVKSYFEVQDVLAKAELYPDLELPTIGEMKDIGYEYVRYKFQDSRVYVDPDFYFIYPYNLSSQILRESVLNASQCDLGATKWKDKTGAEMTTVPKAKVGYEISNRNAVSSTQHGKVIEAAKAKSKQDSKNIEENIRKGHTKALNVLNYGGNHESWDVCKDIKALFLEDDYKKDYRAYCAAEANGSVQAVIDTEDRNKNTANDSNQVTEDSVAKTDDEKKESEEKNAKKVSQGKWVFKSLQNAAEASKAIEEYLSLNYINEAIPDKSPVIEAVKKAQSSSSPKADRMSESSVSGKGNEEKHKIILNMINSTIDKFLSDAPIINIFELINIEISDKFKELTKSIVYSAACAATGEKEYTKKQSLDWKPNPDFIGVRIGGAQDTAGRDMANDVQDAIKNAVEFGCFKIKMYRRNELASMIDEDVIDPWDNPNSINTTRYLIDPYYRYNTVDVIEGYKKGCINNPSYCAAAFFRIMLFWLKKLIDCHAIPTITSDVLRKAAAQELNIEKACKDNNVADATQSMQKHIEFFTKNIHAVDAGKMWTAAVMAASDNNTNLFRRIDNRDYKALNAYVQNCSRAANTVNPTDNCSLAIRKMTLALAGMEVIENIATAGVQQDTPATTYLKDMAEKKYLEAAEDPEKYIVHSCHDMIVNDGRGRMIRAFPTFYMLFVDEGREIGMWRLHDNFYNSSAIMDMQIVKSRKLPADTANITMSNFYQTYTTENEDAIRTRNDVSWGDAFDSIFSPSTYAQKEEAKRSAAPPEARIRLRAGARIHLRMGYGSNAAALPIAFNGTIAEVSAEDTVQIIAQGDGIELMNPILEDEEAHNFVTKDEWSLSLFRNGDTPKNIMNSILTTNGGLFRTILKEHGHENLLGANPYGLFHFGNKDYKVVLKSGEPTQNIFETITRPAWGDDENKITNMYALDEAPHITFNVFGKTIWDVANICKSVSPDFIAGVTPFGFRSTLFIGAPRYYYAYDYVNVNGAVLEKRKPYQQFHMYTSSNDIIRNGVAASSQQMKTCATGLYQVADLANIKNQKKVGPLFADIEIYPEEQRTMIVDTSLYGKGVPILGTIGNVLMARDFFDYMFDEKGAAVSHEKLAWRMTASALKDSMKDMYCGDMVVIGDPTVKPHDRVMIVDNYEGITGQCTVKEVVHHFSVDNGFITTISPDLVVAVDDPHELVAQSYYDRIGSIVSCFTGITAYTAACLYAGSVVTIGQMASKLKPTKAINFVKGSKMITETAGKVSEKVGSMLAKGGIKRIFGGAVAGAGAAAAGVAGASGLTAAVIGAAVVWVATEAVGSFVNQTIERNVKNWQVLQIFPLKKHGLVYVAGVSGSRGLVFGSPTFNDPGKLKSMFTSLAGKSDSGVMEFVKGFFFSDEVRALAEKYRRDGGVQGNTGREVKDEMLFQHSLKAMAASGDASGASDYRSLQILPRANYNSGDDVKCSYDTFSIMDTSQYQNDPKMQNNKLISADLRIEPYLKEQFFQILHETPALNKGEQVETKVIQLSGTDTYIKVITKNDSKGNPVHDIPLLNADAIHVLYEIIRRTKNKMPDVNAQDEYGDYAESKETFIMLKSALRVGDTESQASAGFTFILEGKGEAITLLPTAIDELHKEIETDAAQSDIFNKTLFDAQSLSGGEVVVVVRMPAVTSKNANKDSQKGDQA